MTKKFVWAPLLLLLCACVKPVFAMGELIFVTKETQAKLGLRFTLTAERVSDTAVLVRMEIPQEGKLKGLRNVNVEIGTGNGSPELSIPARITSGKNGSSVVSFQLSPTLAEKCSINLIAPGDPPIALSYEVYAVALNGYVTVKK